MAEFENLKKEIEIIKEKIKETEELLKSPENQELFILAEEELKNLEKQKKELEKELEKSKDKDKLQTNSVIIEIRAGTGGQEAALFVADLYRMYTRYAQIQGWEQKVLDSRKTEIEGLKEIIFELKNGNVFEKMKYEGGVHRVQRIPKTEKAGRVHTSTVSIAILPKPKKTELKLDPKNLKVDTYKSSGPGGQYVNKRETAIRITHIPTGIIVTSQTERNQLENKENALKILEARVLEKKQIAEEEKIGGKRNAQIGWAKRAEKIRTYNFPQNRLTDHRIKKSWHNLEEIMDGRLDKIIKKLENEIPTI